MYTLTELVLKYSRLEPAVSEILAKDKASVIASSSRIIAVGTHAGMVHILSPTTGQKISSYRAHTASVMDIVISDDGSEFIGTCSMDGKVVINSLLTPERYIHQFPRPLRSLALEPFFAKRSSKAFICGGMAGTLSFMEKAWSLVGGLMGGLGGGGGTGGGNHKETILHEGEGPIWAVKWANSGLVAWANDLGVKIYDTSSEKLLTYIDRPANSPRADLYKPTLHFVEPASATSFEPIMLIIGWADYIKLVRVRSRISHSVPSSLSSSGRPASIHRSALGGSSMPGVIGAQKEGFSVEIKSIFQLDCHISSLIPFETSEKPTSSGLSFLVLAFLPPSDSTRKSSSSISDENDDDDDEDNASSPMFRRVPSLRPELRIISGQGEELSSDALTLAGYEQWSCNDYWLVPTVLAPGSPPSSISAGRSSNGAQEKATKKPEVGYVVLSPKDIVVARKRGVKDHIAWLVERKRYQEALDHVGKLTDEERGAKDEHGEISVRGIGEMFLRSLMESAEYEKAASLCPRVLDQDKKAWEDWIFLFAQKHQLQVIIPYVPTTRPQLSDMVYEMMFAHMLTHDKPSLLRIIKTWPSSTYRVPTVIDAIEGLLADSSGEAILMECLAELYLINGQPAKALPYFIRLRRSNVFDLIRQYDLFEAVKDQALLLVEFDSELISKPNGPYNVDEGGRKTKSTIVSSKEKGTAKHGKAIKLLVDHCHSIPIARVFSQLSERPEFLYMYLDSLFEKDPYLVLDYGDEHVELCADYDAPRLMDLLRSSVDYSLEKAYYICKAKDFVPEMVFLLGRMGNNKDALMLIIERLNDVQRAIEFAREQNDEDLWEDLLHYSENKPAFIRVLLQNVGADIDPIMLIRRIKNGLEIPGLKDALIKILQDFQLQTTLLENCQTILNSDCNAVAVKLYKARTRGHYRTAMQYLSTRGGQERLSFEEAVLTGLAPNGGLYIPSQIPSLPADWETSWRGLSFSELSHKVLSLFIPESEIPSDDLKTLVDTSYGTFRHPETTPLHQIASNEYILELFHGPTFAFKDVALQFLGNLFEYFLKRRNAAKKEGEQKEKLTIVGATSGDTGSAAIYGVRGKEDISIFMLFPKGRVSPIQEAQMTSVLDSNVHCIAVEGTFDDCQDTVKSLFSDPKFNSTHRLGAVNSINWARILAQIVYYFHAYLSLPPSSPQVQFVVPTGNFGDILAGYYAKRLGLPMAKLVVATNENDILARFWKTGRYEKVDSAPENGVAKSEGGVKETLSPAMDIMVSSNFERLLWYLALEANYDKGVEGASALLKGWMDQLKSTGRVDVGQSVLALAKRDFDAQRVSDEQTTATIQQYYSNSKPYVADPHTAVGLTVTQSLLPSSPADQIFITLSTAHPAKFLSAVQQALPSLDFDAKVMPVELRGIEDKERRLIHVHDGEEGVRRVVERFAVNGKEIGVEVGEGEADLPVVAAA
ncbi:Pyridoxalphosphate-dependent enzyme/predicted threonine synthase [Phaffia rhodozyma]|uniref:threonine synthase n=1 Tax=Phaffia rhodozyma TaxID=264483 RepID=A0A0F7SNC4_PHARH|nr:Pyridoxalphosphate-dependent enzyme/predicted threonine synthase [Phaffia rhodozyma]